MKYSVDDLERMRSLVYDLIANRGIVREVQVERELLTYMANETTVEELERRAVELGVCRWRSHNARESA